MGITLLPDGTVVVGTKRGTLMAARADGKGGLVMVDMIQLGDFLRTANAVRACVRESGQEGGREVVCFFSLWLVVVSVSFFGRERSPPD